MVCSGGALMYIAPVRPPRVGSPMASAAPRLRSLPPPMAWPPPPPQRPLPSFDDPITLHDDEFEEIPQPAPPPPSSQVVPRLRFAVYAGQAPGEIVLRPLAPNQRPPAGVPVARLDPSGPSDAQAIARWARTK